MTNKKLAFIFLSTITIFTLANFSIWTLFTKQILTRDGDFVTGDLARIGYLSHAIHKRKNEIDLQKQHDIRLKNTHYELLTIGDSFSQGHSGGRNRYYQDYIATKFNWNVLNIAQYPNTQNYSETIIALANNGFLKKYHVQYILIESTQRRVIERFVKQVNYSFSVSEEEIENFYRTQKEHSFELPAVSAINNGNIKFIFYSFLYFFSERAFISDVHKVKLNQKFFSTSLEDYLLYYHKDVSTINKNTLASLEKVNFELNALAQFLKEKNIQLIFMPAVSKYDLYSSFIIDNKNEKDPFFDIFRTLKKEYIFIDTKAILLDELQKSEQDIFYCDDTHWSYKASSAIANALSSSINSSKSY